MIEQIDPETVKAEIDVKMGAMSMKFTGTVSVVERDDADHRAVMRVKSREAGGQGHANADVTFTLSDGGGTVHTAAQITGKAASMGEGVVSSVLDALIKRLHEQVGRPPEAVADGGDANDARGPAGRDAGRRRHRRSRRTRTGRCSRGNGDYDYVCVKCGTVLAAAMDPEYMTRRVRVRCARCRTVNIAAEHDVQQARRPRERG